MDAKQSNYIHREQEYRKVIEKLKQRIESESQKPLARVVDKSQDFIQMDKINISLSGGARHARKANDSRETNIDGEEEGANDMMMYDQKPDKKQINDLWNHLDDMDKNIGQLNDTTLRRMSRFKKKWLERMNAALQRTKEEQLFNSAQQKKQTENQGDREKTLGEQLELMTVMAQELDAKHRILEDREQELKIEFAS